MNANEHLRELGQSLWLDNITRKLLASGTLAGYLRDFAVSGAVSGSMPADGGDAEQVLAAFARAGVDDAALAIQLQREGAESFSTSWKDLLAVIAGKGAVLG